MTDPGSGSGSLAGQVAIVTGGGRGIGREIAQALSRAGAKVAVAARTQEQLDETLALVRQQGGEAISFALDVTDQAAVEGMVAEVERQLGPVDLLVNNAGMHSYGLVWDEDADAWWRVVDVNLHGPYLCSRAVLKGMVARRRGRIINVVSGAGTVPSAFYSSYPVSKAALFRLTDCMAAMTAAHGISVFAISPGRVRTGLTQNLGKFKETREEDWVPIEKAGRLCVLLATGRADRLSGRFLPVREDIEALIARADEIIKNDAYALRLRK